MHNICCRSCQFIQREQLVEQLSHQLHVQQDREYHPISPIPSDKLQLIDWRKRIIDWMIQAANEFDMDIHTVSIAVFYMDRYFVEVEVNKSLIQLVAMVSLSLASKINESQPVSMTEMLDISKGTFQKRDILDVERQLLGFLKWKLNPPSAYEFVRKVLYFIEDVDLRNNLLVEIFAIIDEFIKDPNFVQYSASTVALAAIQVVHVNRNQSLNDWIQWGLDVLPVQWPMGDIRSCIQSMCTLRTSVLPTIKSSRERATSPTSVAEGPEIEYAIKVTQGRHLMTNPMTAVVVDVSSSNKRQRRS